MDSHAHESEARLTSACQRGAAQVLVMALVALSVVWLSACTTSTDAKHVQRKESPTLDQGKRLYMVSCAGCHGADAHGNGPVASVLAVKVPDLTLIASRRGGVFPGDEVYRIVDGQADLSAHGPRHMPVWGYEFFGEDPDDEVAHRQATQKIERLERYLESIQRSE